MNNLKAFIHKYLDGAYKIGIVENWDIYNTKNFNSKINWIDTRDYNIGWFADPFIIEADDENIILLVEEFRYATCKGHLSKITISRDEYKLVEVTPILEMSSHLSFPYIMINEGEAFVCPENNEANEVSIYKFDGNKLYEKNKILSGKYVDTQIEEIDGNFYAFTTLNGNDSYGGASILEIFRSKNLHGPYTHFQSIVNQKSEERGAGLIFRCGKNLIRPSQNCVLGYGKGVVFNSLELKDGKFVQTQLSRIDAEPQYKNGLCLHTFSVYGNLVAVDGFDYPSRWIGRISPMVYGVKRCLLKLMN